MLAFHTERGSIKGPVKTEGRYAGYASACNRDTKSLHKSGCGLPFAEGESLRSICFWERFTAWETVSELPLCQLQLG